MTTTPKIRSTWKLLAGGLALAALSGTALARDNVSFSISLGVPVYVAPPQPAYIYERPVFYSPPPVVYAPQVVYAQPRVVYGPPVYYSPAPRWHDHGRHRGWR